MKLNASSQLMYNEAVARGIKCTLFKDKHTIYMENNNNAWYVRGSRTSFQSSVGKTIGDYKHLTKDVLFHFNIPTSKYTLVKNTDDLTRISKLKFPLVMKPINASHGSGVIVGINNFDEARKKYIEANRWMLFEEMLKGVEYRVVCVDYKFVAASFRKPAFVTGDGKQSIKELIEEKNKHPWRGMGHSAPLSFIEIDEKDIAYLKHQGFNNFSEVPTLNKDVFIKRTANLSTGGEAHNVTDLVSEQNRQLFEKIARVTDLNVIGIDVMCDNLETSILEQPNAGIIEVNPSPGLRMHHFPMKGKPVNVAGKILDMVDSYLQIMRPQ